MMNETKEETKKENPVLLAMSIIMLIFSAIWLLMIW